MRGPTLSTIATLATMLSLAASGCDHPCGADSEECCSTAPACQRGLYCQSGGCNASTCVPCGGIGQHCCESGSPCGAGSYCSRASYVSDATCVACGGPGDDCCGGSACNAGLECQASTVAGTGTCVTCGEAGQPCCAGRSCHNALVCNENDTCGLCGAPGEACCDGLLCTSPAVCIALAHGVATCANCGGVNEPCCGGVNCTDPATFCAGGTCQPCGSLGGPCCQGNTCPISGLCISGVCEAAPADAGVAACSGTTCSGQGMVCIPFPAPVCSHSCASDGDCAAADGCARGFCAPACIPGGAHCDAIGGACFGGIAPFTTLDAPTVVGTPTCIPSCYPSSAALPSGVPACPSGTTCDPTSGQCIVGSAGTVALGAPCTGSADCEGECLAPFDTSGVPTGFIGGYCVSFARNPSAVVAPGAPLSASNCASGGVAIPMPTSGAGDAVACYAACMTDCDCRIGYACDHDPLRTGTPSPNGACLPIDCSLVDAVCPDGFACYHGGPFSHLLHPVCGPAMTMSDAGIDGGFDPARTNDCAPFDAGSGGFDGGMDASTGGD